MRTLSLRWLRSLPCWQSGNGQEKLAGSGPAVSSATAPPLCTALHSLHSGSICNNWIWGKQISHFTKRILFVFLMWLFYTTHLHSTHLQVVFTYEKKSSKIQIQCHVVHKNCLKTRGEMQDSAKIHTFLKLKRYLASSYFIVLIGKL